MIYTLTVNPSLDYIMETDKFNIGEINRIEASYILAGGKGINVSTVLTNLGVENRAILPVGGFSGDKLLAMLDERNILYDALRLENGDTRINVKILGTGETQLNAKGADLTEEDVEKLLGKFDRVKDGDFLILSGSVPGSLGSDFYGRILEHLKYKNIHIVVDTSGENLRNVLAYKPFLIKPNQEELEEIFGQDSLETLAEKAQSMGALNVLVSLGGKGAMLLTKQGDFLYMEAPAGAVINTVGAGDSMVAGFIAGLQSTKAEQEYLKEDFKEALKMAVAAGSASAFSKHLATKEEIDALYKSL